ncbi:MAG: MFS transporter [Clostridia bacterium]|nr:MFS transporter [Clostridia bacterium]
MNEKLMKNEKLRNALYLGVLCSIAYFTVYIARNVLSAVTPAMVENGYNETYIGSVSSLYLVFYAVGQLVNGFIGDKIKAKYMISFGLALAGVTNLLFPLLIGSATGAMLVYSLTGFFLSMIYGPMTKVVSENTTLLYATRCSLGYTFASFFGSPAAGFLAVFLSWQSVFFVSSAALLVMGVSCLLFFLLFEKKGIVTYGQYKPKQKGIGSISVLFRRQIVKFSFISILTGIVRTSVVFWLPTYISQHLSFDPKASAVLFSVATLAISLTTFVAVFVYEKLGHNMDKTILLMFSLAALFFFLTYILDAAAPNLICMVLAIMSSGGAATMLWSRYCPSLYDTGLVSTATGYLDFLSYTGAAIANLLFADAIHTIGWGWVILVWCGLMVVGVFISLPYKKKGGRSA